MFGKGCTKWRKCREKTYTGRLVHGGGGVWVPVWCHQLSCVQATARRSMKRRRCMSPCMTSSTLVHQIQAGDEDEDCIFLHFMSLVWFIELQYIIMQQYCYCYKKKFYLIIMDRNQCLYSVQRLLISCKLETSIFIRHNLNIDQKSRINTLLEKKI